MNTNLLFLLVVKNNKSYLFYPEILLMWLHWMLQVEFVLHWIGFCPRELLRLLPRKG